MNNRKSPTARFLGLLSLSVVIATSFFVGNLFADGHVLSFNTQQSKAEFTLKFAAPRSTKVQDLNGSFNSLKATMEMDGDTITALEASTEILAINTENKKRDKHLQKDDFFGAKAHPTIDLSFVSYSSGTLIADLTIRGKTERVTFDTDLSSGSKVVALTLKSTINRSKFGVAPGFKSTGSGMIADDIDVTLSLIFNRG